MIMERKNKVVTEQPVEEKIRWVNRTGGGSFWLNGHIIKPGQPFLATLAEVPEAFRDQIQPMDGLPDPTKPVVKGKVSTFSMVEVEDPKREEGDTVMYNVINEKGKLLNGKPLTKEKAEALLENLKA